MSIRTRVAAAMAALVFATAAFADNVRGTWSPPFSWPLISAHAVLTPDGRVLTYGTDGNGKQTGYFIYDVWDPAAGTSGGGHLTLPNATQTDIFCSSQIIMPQSGNIFVAGGDNWTGSGTTNTGNNNTNIFNPLNNTLARGNNMNRSRWYSTSTTLLNGEIYIQGGTSGGDRPEIRGNDGTLRLLSNVNTSGYSETYPRNFLAPDGRVFGFDNAGKMYYVNPAGTGLLTTAGQLPGATSWTASAAMFQPGRIIQMGGASSAALVIDINGVQPVVTTTQSMSSQRQWVSATVLPDGRVLGTGGSSVENQLNGVNNVAEIWNPATGTWTQGAAGTNARLYHSFALLLPDATVLVGGGGAPGPLVNLNSEIYYPPYLYDSTGARAARPSIISAPDTVMPGQLFQVGFSGASSISRVSFIKTGSTTHSNNMDQRYLQLPFTANGNLLDVQLPSRAGDVPPGYYMLFVLNSQGVPSVARMVRVGITTADPGTGDFIAAAGGNGGGPFTLACETNEVMVGVRGSTATYVNQVGPLCVPVNQSGQWIGSPVERGITGGAGTTNYSKICPANQAIAGFRGRFSTYVDQLDFECRPLASNGKLTGNGTFLGAVGPNTGTAQGPWRCDSGNPGFALYGRSGSWMDNFGLQCRQASVTVVNTPPTLANPGSQSSPVGSAVDVPASASDPDGNTLTFSAIGLPPGLSVNTNTGRITGSPTTAGNYAVALSVFDGTVSATVNFSWTITTVVPFSLDPLPPATPKLAGTPVSYTASARNGVNVTYSWFFDDGTPATAPSSSPTITHTFANPGIYYVTVTASSQGSASLSETVAQSIYLQPTANKPTMSSNILYENANGGRIWVVNQDNNSVSVFNASTNAKIAEITVGTGPRTLAIAPNGFIAVVNRHSGTISVIHPTSFVVGLTLTMPAGSQPYGIAFAPTGGFAFVTLEGSGQLVKLNAATGAVVSTLNVGSNPRHVSVNADGTQVYVSRFITPPLPGEGTAQVQPGTAGGEVVQVSAANMTVTRTITLRYSDLPDFEIQGAGIPNYLGAMAISPDGGSGWVPSKQDNILRGTLRNGSNLNFQNTVRAITSRVNLGTGVEDLASRVDVDNASLASAALFDPYGNYLFVALETSREVAVLDAQGRYEIFRFNVGRAPQGLAISADGNRLYVNNFMDRTVGVYDLSRLLTRGESNVPPVATLPAVATEALSAQVLKGKQFFYDARDTRLARDGYMSCASCHNDGGHDGRTWDLTGMGEGLRNTVNLRGRASTAQGFLHWSGNFDELQDFEGQIRALAGGTGLMSDADFNTGTRSQPLGTTKAGVSADLDALAAYVASLNTFANSPLRNNGAFTAAATAGRNVFIARNCAQCHGGTSFTDSAAANLRDIGTIKPSSGSRLGGPLNGIDVPTLRDVWATAPYLHDGSAPTIAAAISAHNGVSLSATDLNNLAAYVAEIGAQESSAPAPAPNNPPTLGNPGNQNGTVGVAVNLSLTASDPEGQTVTLTAANLPTGLTINSAARTITGTPTAQGTFNVALTASDGVNNVTQNFTWTIAPAPNNPPVLGNPGNQAGTVGVAVNLSLTVSDPNGDTVTLTATGLPDGLAINSAARTISGTPTTPGTFSVTVTASDASLSASQSFSWNIAAVPTQPPVLNNPGNQSGTVGVAVSLSLTASDPGGYPLTLAASGLPSGLSLNGAARTISGTPTTAGTFNVTVTASNGPFSTPQSFSWTIDPAPNLAPVLTNPGNRTGTVGTAVNVSIAVSDPNGDPITLSATGLPAGLTVNSGARTITGTPTTAGTYNVTLTASDAEFSVSQGFTWTVNEAPDTTAPSQPGLTVAVGNGRPLLTWTASTDNIGVTGYIVYRSTNGTQGSEVARTAGNVTSWSDPSFQENVAYTYSVRAFDAANNQGALSALRSLTVNVIPSTPTLSVSLNGSGDPVLTWTASTDNVGVVDYLVYRSTDGGVGVAGSGSVTGLTGVDIWSTPGVRYYYNVRARDAAGNLSDRSPIVSIVAQ
ncbi:MAG TPA: putative Ig domain-containing protein [Steroidobacteraceae bacterium]|nr:putative Ig domain-containing protein [Steroidobacteraceae bacterium]